MNYIAPIRRPILRHTTEFKVPKPIKNSKRQNSSTFSKGPMALLIELFESKRPVCVWIRRKSTIRGTCSGHLRAFDKHFNMVV